MGHSGLRTGYNERTFTAQVIVQHHGAVQPHTAISRLARAPSRPQITHTARHCALKKQPAKADHFTLVNCGSET